ncbi:Telomerase reverse transcriptase [Lecanora helva]
MSRTDILSQSIKVGYLKQGGATDGLIQDSSAFKIQAHRMFLDSNFNSLNTVLSTIYQNFAETSMKYYRYMKCMGHNGQPHLGLLIGTISDLVDLAFVLIKGKHRSQLADDYACAVSKCQVQW